LNKKSPAIIILISLTLISFGSAEYAGGSGSSTDPYQISSCEQLQNIQENPNDYFELVIDVDCSETPTWNDGDGFEPIDNFEGVLDGQFYDIEGLYIDREGETHVGLFSRGGGFEVIDLRIVNADVSGSSRVGTLTGSYYSDSRVENLGVIDSSVSGTSGYVGGIAGDDDHSEGINFRNSYVQDTEVVGEGTYVGGFDSRSGSSATIEESQIEGGLVQGESQVGGLVGRTSSSSGVIDSYSGVHVIGDGDHVGGMIGYTSTAGSTFAQLYSYGEVEGGEGLFGTGGDGGDTVNDAYFDQEEAGTSSDGWDAQPLDTDQMTGEDAETYMENFDFENIWDTVPDDYPQLQGIVFGTREPEFSESGGDRYPEDGAVIAQADTDMWLTVSHPDGMAMNVEFIEEDRGQIANVRVDESNAEGGYTASTIMRNLDTGEEYNWKVNVTDDDGDFVETDYWSFTVDFEDEFFYRDDDFHPQGADIPLEEENPHYEGHIIQLNDNSSQLEPGMDTSFFGLDEEGADPNIIHIFHGFIEDPDDITGADGNHPMWFDSLGQPDRANEFAIAEDYSWVVGNTGHPYPPGEAAENDPSFDGETTDIGTYIHPGYQDGSQSHIRSNPDDPTLDKAAKAFGNSYAAVAAQDFGTASEGEGVWINPDDIKRFEEYYMGSWEDKLHFSIDLTGPDAGLGFDSNTYESSSIDEGSYRHPSGAWNTGSVVVGDIYWQRAGELEGEPTQDRHPYLNPEMCGDDQSEYLVEEIGAINNSERFEGNYACAQTNQVCYASEEDGQKIFARGEYIDTEDWTEQEGRLKEDLEKCDRELYDTNTEPRLPYGDDIENIPSDDFPAWYDQDFAREIQGNDLCRENTLYGDEGKRWIDDTEVNNHPLAFYNGINDDWNSYLENKWDEAGLEPIESRRDDLSLFLEDDWVSEHISPVDTGTNRTTQATLGFCAGDDEGEYLLTQQSETRLIDSRNEIKGAGSDSSQCVLDGPSAVQDSSSIQDLSSDDLPHDIDSNEASEERILYNAGDIVDVTLDGGSTVEVACFEGTWFEDWPVTFDRETMTVPFEHERTVGVRLVNPTEEDIIYNVDVEAESDVDGLDLGSFTTVRDEEGMSFETEVSSRDSTVKDIEVYGGNTEIDEGEITVSVEDNSGDITGEDQLEVNIEDLEDMEGEQAQAVPGIAAVQIIFVILLSLIVMYRKN